MSLRNLSIDPCVRFASMSDEQLHREHRKCSDEIATASRWGASVAEADEARDLIEDEMCRRRVAVIRTHRAQVLPVIVDDPGVEKDRTSTARAPVLPVITGIAKARTEWSPPKIVITIATAVAVLFLLAAATLASQRAFEIELAYASDARV